MTKLGSFQFPRKITAKQRSSVPRLGPFCEYRVGWRQVEAFLSHNLYARTSASHLHGCSFSRALRGVSSSKPIYPALVSVPSQLHRLLTHAARLLPSQFCSTDFRPCVPGQVCLPQHESVLPNLPGPRAFPYRARLPTLKANFGSQSLRSMFTLVTSFRPHHFRQRPCLRIVFPLQRTFRAQ